MHGRETSAHLLSSLLAVLADSLAIIAGLWFAVYLRFHTDWFPVDPSKGQPSLDEQHRLILIASAIFLLVFRSLELYRRPHQGRFEDKIPRILRAILLSFVLYFALENALRLDPPFSRVALAFALFTVPLLLLLERYLLYRIELHEVRHAPLLNRVLLLGADNTTQRLRCAIESDKFLQAKVIGVIRTQPALEWDPAIPLELRRENPSAIEEHLAELSPNHIVIADASIPRPLLLHIALLCEQRYLSFHLVPDLFRLLTTQVQVRHLEGIPIMGLGNWPLDRVGARFAKRTFDIVFSSLALLLSAPLLLLCALAVKITSPGPVFYLQERCGEKGRSFRMIKLRTMRSDAELQGPGWTRPNDPRRTPIGAFLRKWNLDELPQFLNVLAGHMSVVGPRPERPHYVEQFKDEIERYMRRHLHKPGITGWAQVHGLRGDTSIQERITHDLFYFENWSLGLDIKIIIKTLFSRDNAY